MDLITNSESLVIMMPSNGSLKAQFVLKMLPSNLNLGRDLVVEASKLSGVIAKSLGMSLFPLSMSMPAP